MISLRKNFLFVHIPKTAGNSIQNVLRAYSEDKIVCLTPFQDGTERFGVASDRYKTHKHSTLREYQTALGNDIFQRLFKFTCVRNPWDRAISWYFSPHRGKVAWNRAQFIELLTEIQPVTKHLSLKDNSNSTSKSFENLDYIIRFENLNDDFKMVCELIDIPWEPLPIRNQSEREHYAKYYDDELIEMTRKKFTDEIRFFGYEFK